jgi:hypothetical protein
MWHTLGKPAAKSRSNSTTVSASHSPINGEVKAAKPGPISTILSPERGALNVQFWQSHVDHVRSFAQNVSAYMPFIFRV